MFAYCQNNPIMLSDPNGNISIFSVIAVAAALTKVVKLVLKESNKKNNSKVDANPDTTTKGKIINDQNGKTGDNFRYGAYPASHNACEAIAVHNAKVLMGDDSSTLSETIYDFQSSGAMIGFGGLGSNPLAIGRVLNKEGIKYSRVGLNDMTEQGVYIMSFWNENPPWNGLHTVAVSYNGINYIAYNLNGNNIEYNISLSDYSKRFICGYYLG